MFLFLSCFSFSDPGGGDFSTGTGAPFHSRGEGEPDAGGVHFWCGGLAERAGATAAGADALGGMPSRKSEVGSHHSRVDSNSILFNHRSFHFPRFFGGFLETRIRGKNGEGTIRLGGSQPSGTVANS